ncbi:hypothetical protein CY35_01G016500 [Sphagnum magellanicum]|nr:hypothetical protein CY35_01G016500 [Sphagnum magellanicum]
MQFLATFHSLVGPFLHFDESVRLWNVNIGVCILIFARAGGHRNEVLSMVSVVLCSHDSSLSYLSRPVILCWGNFWCLQGLHFRSE